MQQKDENWMTAREAAEVLGISYNRISKLISRSAIEYETYKVDGRQKLVNVEEIRRVLRLPAKK